ncbi:hypothetical protein VKT23_005014 [Stygiomarasmius scandens]|uniref:F-box domain-containing protein n=1 Tax=Marasmiellus scandens TaxID=2682957 RepID=A0ABR1JSS0_9AGAR
MTLQLLDLPSDVIIIIINFLPFQEFSALSKTCKTLFNLVDTCGWTRYLRLNHRPSASLSLTYEKWSPTRRAGYNLFTDDSWSKLRFVARPLSRPWAGKFQPVLALSNSRLVVAAGCTIHSYKFSMISEDTPSLQYEGTISLNDRHNVKCDITSLTFIQNEKRSQCLLCGLQNGSYAKVIISMDKTNKMNSRVIPFNNYHPNMDTIESLSAESSLVLSVTSSGNASLMSTTSPDSVLSSIRLEKRSWKTFLSTHGSSPFAAFGTSSDTPLSIHSVLSGSELSSEPTAILATKEDTQTFRPAVYGICHAPLSSPWGSSPEIIISGWFDGQVRCHDLRTSPGELGSRSNSPSTSEDNNDLVPHRPVLTLSDPWTYDPIYSVSSGGGSASHIAAGSARHSVVSFWDIRYPTKGWSVFAPGNDRSPVYDVVLESSRVFGVTDTRPFVYDFGPGITKDTYPLLHPDNLKKRKSNPINYYVTKYSHVNGIMDT